MGIEDKIRRGKLSKGELIELASNVLDLRNKDPNSIGRRAFLKAIGLTGVLAACDNCKNPTTPIPISDEYTITLDCYDMTSLNGMNFGPYVNVPDARVIINGIVKDPGVYTFSHKGHTVNLDFTGSVHDTVLCVRKPNSTTNLYQTQNGIPANVNLQSLGQGNNVRLELYKIPSWVDINWVREALQSGTAIYNQNVTVWLANEGYSDSEWNTWKPTIAGKVNNALNEINLCLTGIIASLNETATSGQVKVRLNPANINPSSSQSGSGIMTWSNVNISALSDGREYLEEFYHALGVRRDIGNIGLSNYISNNTDRLVQFGKALMRINYFLNPNTTL